MKHAISIICIIAIVLGLTLPGVLRADDTEIYGTVNISLAPNVLIIFDTSGSMSTKDVPGEYYDPATTYEGSYTKDAVYERVRYCSASFWQWCFRYSYRYDLFADDVNDLNCDSVKDDLLTQGYTTDYIKDSSYTCGGSERKLRLGNYLNYEESGVGEKKTRISVAQEVITDLINNTANVRFGLMRFNYDQGGRIAAEIGTDKTTLINAVNGLTASGWTPLAETLAEAGLYLAGKDSWFNSGTYTSPMQERCQKSYIIIMTDGEPTQDIDSRLTSGTYINGDTIGDYDNDGNDPGSYSSNGSDYLDDVAKYLYENDCNPTLGTGTSFETQNIITYTIGFKTQQQLLEETAINGGGEYYTAENITALSQAFEEIMSSIAEVNATFVSPVVPVSPMNRTFAGDYLYVGFFKPQQGGNWIGNIKKYGLGSDGQLLDNYGVDATVANGRIKDNARSYWSFSADGPDVAAGGVGEILLDQTTRNLYTYMGTQTSLTQTDNQFSTDNTLITNAVLGVSSEAERQNLINEVYGADKSWMLGDILHSQPTVVHYDTDGDGELDATYIFVGSNDGMMHCFNDSDGSELWGFIPPDQLARLPLLLDDVHDYFVDGSPVVYEGATQKILLFGERRGGDHYYALDVTTVAEPQWLYKIEPDILGGGLAQLGQSWSRPEIHTIKTGYGTEDTVFLIAGGYDTNQDLDSRAATDSLGRAVFAVKVTDGTISSLNFNAGNYTDMTHCIVDVSGFDSNGDGYANRIYAGDLGGQVFAFEDDNGDGTWSARRLFSVSALDGVQRKILYAPDAVEESFGEIIFFGTGDRADPAETGVENRIYAVKNEWVASESFTTLTESDLVDVTDDLIQLGTAEQKSQVRTDLETSKGWYIRLENQGEKVTSSPTVYGGAVYFTTYIPDPEGTGVDPDDPCGASTGRGVASLYEVNYLTGASVTDYCPIIEIDQGTGEAAELGKLDRRVAIGTSIPSAPTIAVLEGGAKIFTGIEGGIAKNDPVPVFDMNIFYWRQIF